MTAQWCDFPSNDLGLYGGQVARMSDGPWAAVGGTLVNDPDPTIGAAGSVLRMDGPGGGTSSVTRKVLTGDRTTVGFSARIWVPFIPPSELTMPCPFDFRDSLNNILCGVYVTPTGALQVRKGQRNNNVIVGATGGPAITANAWTHLSVKATFGAGATGSISIEREGVNILNLINVDIGAAQCAQVAHVVQSGGIGDSTPIFVKDDFIWDGLGTVNNNHPGPVTIYRRTVNSDISSGWSRTSGSTDYGLVDETPPDDADYIFAGTGPFPAPSIMGLVDLPADVVAIRGVMMVGRQRKSDGGDCQTQMSITPDLGVNYALGANRTITTAFTYWNDWSEVSPNGGLPWTPIEFNNARIRINRTV